MSEEYREARIRMMSGTDKNGVTHYQAHAVLDGEDQIGEGLTAVEAIENLFKVAYGDKTIKYSDQASWSPALARLRKLGQKHETFKEIPRKD